MNTIKTWENRISPFSYDTEIINAMEDEIIELRAALAARATPAQPVHDLSATKIDQIVRSYFAEPWAQDKAKEAIQEVLDCRSGATSNDPYGDRWHSLTCDGSCSPPCKDAPVAQPSPSSVGAAIRALKHGRTMSHFATLPACQVFNEGWHEALSAAAALAEQMQGQQWISIADKMPESGKRVVFAWTNQLGKARTSMGQWNERWKQVANSSDEDACEYDEEQDEYFLLEGWQEWGWELEFSAYVEGTVTHWMPLPAAPSIAQDGQKSEGV